MPRTSDVLLCLEHLVEGINDPYILKAVFMAGGPGSGKSFVAEHMFGGLGVKFSNSDDILVALAKVRKGLRGDALKQWLDMSDPAAAGHAEKMATRERARALAPFQQVQWMNSMLGVVIDGTGRDVDHIKQLKRQFEELGYDTSMVFVNTTLEVAQARNAARDRKVDPRIVEKLWNDVQANLGAFQTMFGQDGFFIIDQSASVEPGSPAEQALGKALRVKAMKLLARPLRNPLGQSFVWALRQTGGKVLSDLLPRS